MDASGVGRRVDNRGFILLLHLLLSLLVLDASDCIVFILVVCSWGLEGGIVTDGSIGLCYVFFLGSLFIARE